MSAETWAIARFTVLMALLATTLVLPPAIAIGWLLARKTFPAKRCSKPSPLAAGLAAGRDRPFCCCGCSAAAVRGPGA